MATIEITISDAKLTQALDSIANQTGWDPGGGTTKAQHAKAWLFEQVKVIVRADLSNIAHDAGQESVEAEMATWP